MPGMNREKIRTVLIWLPSIIVSIFFVVNAFEKIFPSREISKPGFSNTTVLVVGIALLIATGLFLMKRTVVIGTILLASYMLFVVFLHASKGKPFLLTVLIVLLTIFSGYLRKSKFSYSHP